MTDYSWMSDVELIDSLKQSKRGEFVDWNAMDRKLVELIAEGIARILEKLKKE